MERAFTRYAASGRRRKTPVLLRLIVGLIVLLAAALLGGWLWVHQYIESDDFRSLVSRKTSAALGVEGNFSELKWSGTSAYSNAFTATGAPGSPVATLRAEVLRSELEIGAVLEGVWRLPKLEVGLLDVEVREASKSEAGLPESRTAEPAASSWLPSKVELQETHVNDARVRWPGGKVEEVRLTMKPVADDVSVTGGGGTLSAEHLPTLVLDDFQLRVSKTSTHILSANLHRDGGGVLRASGEISRKSASHIRADFEALPSEAVLNAVLTQHLKGILRGGVDVRRAAPGASWLAKGTVTMRDGLFKDLPVLKLLAQFTGLRQFEHLVLQTTEVDFEQFAERIVISRFLSESEGLVRVEGQCTVENGRMDGVFEVGVTSGSLRWIPGAQEKVFTTSRGAYHWTTVKVTGPLNALQNDLSPRLAAAVEGAVLDTVTGTVEGATEILKEGTRGVLDLLLPR